MTSPIIDFIAARLNEDEAAAQAAIDPDRPGTHWQWVNDETDEPIGDMDKESASSGLSLRTVEEFGETRKIGSTTIGPLPAFVIYTAEDIIPGAGDHIARHDPARVLREVAAKRAILEAHAAVRDESWQSGADHDYQWCASCGSLDDSPTPFPCVTVLALAAIWSDHPDFDPNWSTT